MADLPNDVRKPACTTTLVSGPPGSGKSTWVMNQLTGDDRVLDIDLIKQRIAGKPRHMIDQDDWSLSIAAMEARNQMVRDLFDAPATIHAYLIVGGAAMSVRRHWMRLLGCRSIVIKPRLETVLKQIDNDPNRKGIADLHKQWAIKWYKDYTTCPESEVICPP